MNFETHTPKRRVTLKPKEPVVITKELERRYGDTVKDSYLFLSELGFEYIPELNHLMIPDLTLAESLGFDRTRNIRKIISLRSGALLKLGKLEEYLEVSTGPGRKSSGYLLNLEQAFYVITKSDTAVADELTMLMVLIVAAFMRGSLIPADFDTLVTIQKQQKIAMQKHREEKDARYGAFQILNKGRKPRRR